MHGFNVKFGMSFFLPKIGNKPFHLVALGFYFVVSGIAQVIAVIRVVKNYLAQVQVSGGFAANPEFYTHVTAAWLFSILAAGLCIVTGVEIYRLRSRAISFLVAALVMDVFASSWQYYLSDVSQRQSPVWRRTH